MAVLEYMSTNVDPKELSHTDLWNICRDTAIKPDYLKKCQNESIIRYIVGTSVEEGKQQLKRFMTAWEKDGKSKEDAANILFMVNESIERCGGRKSLLTPLGAAKKKLEKVL